MDTQIVVSYDLSSPIISPPVTSNEIIPAVITHHGQIDMVTHQLFIKWWDKFNEEKIIEQD